jgi:hypothetical protein
LQCSTQVTPPATGERIGLTLNPGVVILPRTLSD